MVDLTDSPYVHNTKESAIYVDTPTQHRETPPRASVSNNRGSPYSPSRQLIPPLPVPGNMDIQLKATIPNSKRKFDINKLALSSDNSAALDELKSMLEAIQDALVNIVERSKGNSSSIQIFGTQLREFNETFKQRKENENDLLTTSTFRASQQEILEQMSSVAGQSSLNYELYQLTQKISSTVSDDTKTNRILAKLEEQNHTSDLKAKLDQIQNDMSIKPVLEQLQMTNAILEKVETSQNSRQDEILNSLKHLIDQQETISSPESEDLAETLKTFMIEFESKRYKENVDHKQEIDSLRQLLSQKDAEIEGLKEQHSQEQLEMLETKVRNLQVQELSEQLKQYQLRENLQVETESMVQRSIALRDECTKLETEIESKRNLLQQLSLTFDSRLDQFITLSNKFEELKLKTESFTTTNREKQLLNHVKFDIHNTRDEELSTLSSISSQPTSRSPQRAQRRNITLNENMLSSSNTLYPIDLNSEMFSKLPEKRKLYPSGTEQLMIGHQKKVQLDSYSNKEN